MLFFQNHSFICIVSVFFSFFFFPQHPHLFNNKAGLGLVFIATLSASGALSRRAWGARRIQNGRAGFLGPCEMPVHLSAFAGPEGWTVPQRLGEPRASWAKVRTLPPALRMRFRAWLLTRSAHAFGLGTSCTCTSSVINPPAAEVSHSKPGSFICRIVWKRDIGGGLVRHMNNLG